MPTWRPAVVVPSLLFLATAAGASHTPPPSLVVLPGSFQSELGCSDDWQPGCVGTMLAFEAADGVWQGSFTIPAGNWEYKAALNGTWSENYGANATPGGANIGLNLASPEAVKFYYSHQTHWVADNRNKVIAVAPGSFQSELGCPGDWQPDCLRSWLQDPDGDGIYSFRTSALPAGDYEVKVAINESWAENYGAGGVPNGPNIAFTVPAACREMFFSYDPNSHVLTVSAEGAPRGDLRRARAHWLSDDTIAWDLPGATSAWTASLHYAPDGGLSLGPDGVSGGTTIPLTYDPAGPLGRAPGRVPSSGRIQAVPGARRSPRRGGPRPEGPGGRLRGRRERRARRRHGAPDPRRARRPLCL